MSILKKIKNLFIEELTEEQLRDRFVAQGFDLDDELFTPFNQMEISELADLLEYKVVYTTYSPRPTYRRAKRIYKWEVKHKKGRF